MIRKLGIAFIGVGDVAQRDYLPEFFRLSDRCRLVSVSSRSEGRAEAVAQQFAAEQWTTDPLSAINSVDVDIVVNLTPASAHEEISLAAIRGGKHLYTEKPLADTSSQGRRLADAAAQHGVAVVAAPSVVLFPQLHTAAELVTSGTIGPVYAVRAAAYGGVPPWQGYLSDPTPFFAEGAGPLRDMGVYPLHSVVHLFGEIAEVSARAQRTVPQFTITDGPHRGLAVPVRAPDDWHVTVRTVRGVIADIHASFASDAGLAPDFEILGRGGTIGISLLDVAAPLRLSINGDDAQTLEIPHARSGGPDHILGVEHLVDHILTGTPLVPTIQMAQHVLTVLEAAELSNARAMTVSIGATG